MGMQYEEYGFEDDYEAHEPDDPKFVQEGTVSDVQKESEQQFTEKKERRKVH